MSNCTQIKEDLHQFVDGNISIRMKFKISSHLKNCLECRQEESEIRNIIGLIKNIPIDQFTDVKHSITRIKFARIVNLNNIKYSLAGIVMIGVIIMFFIQLSAIRNNNKSEMTSNNESLLIIKSPLDENNGLTIDNMGINSDKDGFYEIKM